MKLGTKGPISKFYTKIKIKNSYNLSSNQLISIIKLLIITANINIFYYRRQIQLKHTWNSKIIKLEDLNFTAPVKSINIYIFFVYTIQKYSRNSHKIHLIPVKCKPVSYFFYYFFFSNSLKLKLIGLKWVTTLI